MGIDIANLDRSVSPAVDFYRFANGTWLDKNPIPPQYSRWGAFEQLIEKSENQLKEILEESASAVEAADASEDVHTALVGLLYRSGMNEEECDKAGFQPLTELFEAIESAKIPADLVVLSRTLRTKYGVRAGFFSEYPAPDAKNSGWVVLHISQHGFLGIGDRDFYLEEDKKEIREKYVAHVERLLKLSGLGDSATAAKDVLALETKLAEKCKTRTELRDPHETYNKYKMPSDLAAATNTSGKIDWDAFFQEAGFEGDFGGIIVDNPALSEALGKLLDEVSLDTWKAYVRYHVCKSMAPYLGKDAVDEHFGFFDKAMTGQEEIKPRWKRVAKHVGGLLLESLAIKYVDRHFSEDAKKACKEMVDILVHVVKTRIDEVDWMSQDTKKRAHRKLSRFQAKIGYPDKWELDHIPDLSSGLRENVSYAENVMAVGQIEAKRSVGRVNKPVDEFKWEMPPFMVNAYFHPTRNEIVFPSAILQPPFYYPPTPEKPYGDVAVNFAAIGAVICHEISHGYDDKGRQYDENGELNDWWTDQDSEEYKRRSEKMVQQYSEYKVFGVPLNGELCLGENVADLGGVKLAYVGLQKFMAEHGRPDDIDGFSPEQRFFLGWATVWRNNIRKENALQRVVMDPHSPGEFRANGPLQVLPEFHEAFEVSEGDPMFRPIGKRCEIW